MKRGGGGGVSSGTGWNVDTDVCVFVDGGRAANRRPELDAASCFSINHIHSCRDGHGHSTSAIGKYETSDQIQFYPLWEPVELLYSLYYRYTHIPPLYRSPTAGRRWPRTRKRYLFQIPRPAAYHVIQCGIHEYPFHCVVTCRWRTSLRPMRS